MYDTSYCYVLELTITSIYRIILFSPPDPHIDTHGHGLTNIDSRVGRHWHILTHIKYHVDRHWQILTHMDTHWHVLTLILKHCTNIDTYWHALTRFDTHRHALTNINTHWTCCCTNTNTKIFDKKMSGLVFAASSFWYWKVGRILHST